MNRNDRMYVIGLFVLFFIAYAYTAAPSVFVGDSAEMSLTVQTLGVAHPTGFPLYIMAGKLWSVLAPISDVAYRLNLFDACLIALSVAGMFLIIRNLGMHAGIAGCVAGIFGLGRTVWFHATTATVYPMAILFVIALWWIVVQWQNDRRDRWIYWYAGVWGLSLGTHVLMLCMAVPLIVMVWQEKRKYANQTLRAWKILVFGGAPLLQYLYLPWAYARHTYAFTPIRSPHDLYAYLTQQDFAYKMFARTAADIWPFLRAVGSIVSIEYTLVFCLIAVLGIGAAWKANRSLLGMLMATSVANLLMMFLYGNQPDLNILFRYLFLIYIAGAIMIAYALQFVIRQQYTAKRFYIPVLAVLLVMGISYESYAHERLNNHRHHDAIPELAQNILGQLEPRAILFSNGDTVSGALWYVQQQGFRNDVVVIDKNLITLPGYMTQLAERYPDVINQDVLHIQEATPDVLSAHVIAAITDQNFESRAIYKMADHTDKDLGGRYYFVATGLVNRVVPRNRLDARSLTRLLTQGTGNIEAYQFPDFTRRYPDRDEAAVVTMYPSAINNLGVWYLANHDPRKALEYFNRALTYPTSPDFRSRVESNVQLAQRALVQ